MKNKLFGLRVIFFTVLFGLLTACGGDGGEPPVTTPEGVNVSAEDCIAVSVASLGGDPDTQKVGPGDTGYLTKLLLEDTGKCSGALSLQDFSSKFLESEGNTVYSLNTAYFKKISLYSYIPNGTDELLSEMTVSEVGGEKVLTADSAFSLSLLKDSENIVYISFRFYTNDELGDNAIVDGEQARLHIKSLSIVKSDNTEAKIAGLGENGIPSMQVIETSLTSTNFTAKMGHLSTVNCTPSSCTPVNITEGPQECTNQGGCYISVSEYGDYYLYDSKVSYSADEASVRSGTYEVLVEWTDSDVAIEDVIHGGYLKLGEQKYFEYDGNTPISLTEVVNVYSLKLTRNDEGMPLPSGDYKLYLTIDGIPFSGSQVILSSSFQEVVGVDNTVFPDLPVENQYNISTFLQFP